MTNDSNFGLIRPYESKIQAFARLLDVAVIGITLWAVIDINHLEWDSKHSWWLLVSIVTFLFVAELNGLYRERRGVLFIKSLKNILLNWFIVLIALISINQFYLLIDPVYEQVFYFWAGFVPIELLSWHFMVDGFLCIIRKKGRNSRKVAVVGANNLGIELQRLFEQEDWMGMRFSGVYDDRLLHRGEHSAVSIRGNLRELVDQARQGNVDIIYISLPLKAEDRIKDIVSQLADTTVSVYYVPDFFGFDLLRAQWSSVGGITVISIYDSPFYGVDGVLKRIFDVIFSLFALLIVAIPMLIIALFVKLTSSGPILFKQRRFGLDGEEIIVWKFRSMSVTENGSKVTQAKKNDPRVTKLGAVLRKTSLDELPQFINVLQGRMSVVGPRPHAVAHNELYRKQIKGYMLRHKVKPGITGLAQVRGYRGETDTLDKMEGRIKYDLEYIRRWSLHMDVNIILMTIFNVFSSEDVY